MGQREETPSLKHSRPNSVADLTYVQIDGFSRHRHLKGVVDDCFWSEPYVVIVHYGEGEALDLPRGWVKVLPPQAPVTISRRQIKDGSPIARPSRSVSSLGITGDGNPLASSYRCCLGKRHGINAFRAAFGGSLEEQMLTLGRPACFAQGFMLRFQHGACLSGLKIHHLDFRRLSFTTKDRASAFEPPGWFAASGAERCRRFTLMGYQKRRSVVVTTFEYDDLPCLIDNRGSYVVPRSQQQ